MNTNNVKGAPSANNENDSFPTAQQSPKAVWTKELELAEDAKGKIRIVSRKIDASTWTPEDLQALEARNDQTWSIWKGIDEQQKKQEAKREAAAKKMLERYKVLKGNTTVESLEHITQGKLKKIPHFTETKIFKAKRENEHWRVIGTATVRGAFTYRIYVQ